MADDFSKTGEAAARAASDMGRRMADAGASAMAEFTRMFSDMKIPSMPQMDSLLGAYRRNMEVLSAANRVALEGAQMVARRHMEIMQQSMSELTETMRQLAAADAPQEKAARQAEMLKQSYERAVSNIRELSDLIQRSSGEAVEMLNKRFVEAMDEIKSLMAQAQTHAGTQPHG